jgi:hypothetical protein
MKRARRKKVWRVPPALDRFIHGDELSHVDDQRILRLQNELERLLYADHAETEEIVTPEIRAAIHSAWIQRLQAHIPVSNTTFFDDLAEAQRRLHIRVPKTAVQCLAEAYMVLAKPVTVFGWWYREDEFLRRHDGRINTFTVRTYAEILWKNSRRLNHGESILAQLEINLDLGGTVPQIRWTELFRQLGLTNEFLPRERGGRPLREGKTKNTRRLKKLRADSQSGRKPVQKTSAKDQ